MGEFSRIGSSRMTVTGCRWAPGCASTDRINWWANTLEGGLLLTAMAFISFSTLLPSMALSLGAPVWLIAFVPMAMSAGYQLPALLVAHRIGRLRRLKPALLWLGAAQRLPYLVAGLVLLSCDGPVAWIAVAAAPLASGIFGGLGVTALQQLTARTVPAHRRSSMFSWRFTGSAILSIGAGLIVERILESHPGQAGYARLHLITFVVLCFSLLSLAQVREPAVDPPDEPSTGLWRNLRSLPALLRGDARLATLLLANGLATLGGIVIPFLAIHANTAMGGEDSALGQLLAWQMGGSIVGGLYAGRLGDRCGARTTALQARLLMVGVCAIAPFLDQPMEWRLLFAVFGAAMSMGAVSGNALPLELLPRTGQANFLALINAAPLPLACTAALISGQMWGGMGDAAFPWLCLGGACLGTLSWLCLLRLPDPRHTDPSGSPRLPV
jgi:MFS family permease